MQGDTSTSATRGRGRPRAATPRDVQRAAVELFAQHGFSNVSVDDIAGTLGIGRTTFFRYFGSKSGVVGQDYEEAIDRLPALLATAGRHQPAMVAIRSALLEAVQYDEADRRFNQTRLALFAATPELAPERARIISRFARIVADFVRSRTHLHSSPVVPETVGYALVGAMGAVIRMWAEAEPGTSFTDLLRPAIDALIDPFQYLIEAKPPDGRPHGAAHGARHAEGHVIE